MISQNIGGVSHFVADLGVVVRDGVQRITDFAPGDEILIGDPDDAVVFDWDPTVQAFGGRGPRGTDHRLTP